MELNERPLILIVDDNNQNIQVLGGMLAEAGYDIGVAQGGPEAMKFIEKYLPDLILLDIMMPGMDGFEVCETLKTKIRTKGIPIIFLTAKVQTEDIVRGFEAGCVDYVTKPFIQAELLARIKTHIEVKTLRGLISICAQCKKIRNDEGHWKQVEVYIQKHSNAQFSHGLCPECLEQLYGEQLRNGKLCVD